MRTFTRIFTFFALIMIFLSAPANSQMLADITEDINTRFGTYHPYLVTVTPQMDTFVVDTNQILNWGQFNFTPAQKQALLQHGFFVTPGRDDPTYSGYFEIYDIYKECKERGVPIFVTTDALLHTYHIIYDAILKRSEQNVFFNQLLNLTAAMQLHSVDEYYQATEPLAQEAALLNVAYFSVAGYFLDPNFPVPAFANFLVQPEVNLIQAHQGFATSPIFGYPEDYSQFKVRGHYTGSDTLKKYFTSMMWYGKMSFACDPGILLTIDQVRKATLAALLNVQAIATLQSGGTAVRELWESIYLPTVFFVGRADDLHFYSYLPLAFQVYGPDFLNLSADSLANLQLLDQFIAAAQSLPDPLISVSAPKGWRFMGQRFLPDSYFLDQVVWPFVPDRYMPSGLDVMAVLGSARAEELLNQMGAFAHTNYAQQLMLMKNYAQSLPDSAWVQTLYWNWLYCLMPMLFPKGSGYPPYMQNIAWTHKELAAALASWGELRHDTILYVKQSGSYVGIGPDFSATQGFVEPNPHLFARLAALTEYTRQGLNNWNLLTPFTEGKLVDLKDLLLGLQTIAEKELTNQTLTAGEYQTILNIGDTLEKLAGMDDPTIPGSTAVDDSTQMPVIADVHTDGINNKVLEEGSGYPLNIYVVNEIGGELVLTRGATYAYYEFEQPISNRLTDEQWQQMLRGTTPPIPVSWTANYLIPGNDGFFNPNPGHYFYVEENASYHLASLGLLTPHPQVGDTVVIEVHPNGLSVYDLEVLPPGETAWQSYSIPPDNRVALSTNGWNPGKVKARLYYDIPNSLSGGVFRMAFRLLQSSGTNPANRPVIARFGLDQNFPNPFNPTTTIHYRLPRKTRVVLEIYNLLGQKIRILADGVKPAGEYRVQWDGRDDAGREVASGVYVCRLEGTGWVKSRKMLLLR